VAFVVYWLTLAPGLTWRNDGADGGDFLAAVYTLGVPHPSGYPTYVLLGQLFARLPWGDPAYRLNLMSAVAMSLAVGLLAGGLQQVLRQLDRPQPLVAGLAALALAFSPILWSQATITEVYALNATFAALLLYLFLRPNRPVGFLAFLLGLGLGNHLSLILLIPGALIYLWAAGRPGHPQSPDPQALNPRHPPSYLPIARLFLTGLLPFAAGLLVYLYLPWASGRGGVVGWPAATTPAGFWWLVSGAAYQHYLFGLPAEQLPQRFMAWAGLLVRQTGPVGFALALSGAWGLRHRTAGKLGVALFWGGLVPVSLYSLYAIAYNTADSYVFLIPALLIWAIWLAVGAAEVKELLALRGPVGRWAGPALLLLVLLVNLAGNWAGQDLSRDREAADFGQAVMTTVAADAVVLTNSDRHTFALWYYGRVGQPRPDVLVIDRSLLQFDWHVRAVARRRPALAPALAGAFEDRSDQLIAAALEHYAVYITEPDPDLGQHYLLQKEGPVWRIARPVR